MPTIVDYQTVLGNLTAAGLKCNYHNSGSFGMQSKTHYTVGWLAKADTTIRPEMMPFTKIILQPAIPNLLDLFVNAWVEHLRGNIWIMPASHWAYELSYGNTDWLPDRLRSVGIDVSQLENRNDGSAIAFTTSEAELLKLLAEDLLTKSAASDFTAAWPDHDTVAMLHHHQQVWWRTTDHKIAKSL